ncbi:uncharacterized protein LOC131578682 [Poecile atricapillus]|uniref:uncharacterized protein LOC131578682 n=1 Tax=Poecile atricapillus TaxID=48891 RepID=UPI002739D371|nr:uncharacterized protein LOC131578682 [Poecile atricapillus]
MFNSPSAPGADASVGGAEGSAERVRGSALGMLWEVGCQPLPRCIRPCEPKNGRPRKMLQVAVAITWRKLWQRLTAFPAGRLASLHWKTSGCGVCISEPFPPVFDKLGEIDHTKSFAQRSSEDERRKERSRPRRQYETTYRHEMKSRTLVLSSWQPFVKHLESKYSGHMKYGDLHLPRKKYRNDQSLLPGTFCLFQIFSRSPGKSTKLKIP